MKHTGTHTVSKTMAIGIVAMLIVIATSCYNSRQSSLDGSIVRTDDCFMLDCMMSDTNESHSIMMDEGDDIDVRFNVEAGDMDVIVKAPSGEIAYKGNGIMTGNFKLTATEDGYYSIELKAKKFKGSVSFKRIPSES